MPLVVSILDDWLGLDSVVKALVKPLTSQDWGLRPAMIGGFGMAAEDLEHTLARMADPNIVIRGQFEMAYWAPATAAGIVLLMGRVALMASRRPDRLPRLRRPA